MGPAGDCLTVGPYLLRLWSRRGPVALGSLAAQGIPAIARGLKWGVHARFKVRLPCGAGSFGEKGTF
jgi:hypothetical protein